MSVDIVLNGESLTLPANSTLAECLMQQAFLPDNWSQATAHIELSFVVAVNQHVVRWQDWSSIRLASGDAVDVLGAITGG
ncbi:MAG: sulfur carrier protein ThiS [Bacterioplanes sp.]|nr:sulfur carrier protein ThiS [Bacterioplanes sp.]